MDLGLVIRVPASSANLGPGFDTLGLALELYLEARLAEPRAGAPAVRLSGPHTDGIPADDSNIVLSAFRQMFQRAGRAAPVAGRDFTLELRNGIPLGRGLGSSGAAVLAGVMLANHAGGLGFERLEELALAAAIEGHPDNVAASCLGGLVVACSTDSGIEALRLEWPATLSVVIAVPGFALETSKARAALPASYSRADAVFNLQRVALLVGAVLMGSGTAGSANHRHLAVALADRFHQPYRAPLVPGLREALELRAPGLLGVTLSGAGPSLLAFVEGGSGHETTQPVVAALEELYRRLNRAAEVRSINVASQGALVVQKEVQQLGT